jgi:integrase
VGLESCCFTSENLVVGQPILGPENVQFTFSPVRAQTKVNSCQNRQKEGLVWTLLDSNSKPSRRETKLLWPEAKEILEFLGRYLPKQRLVKALTVLSDARKRRFLRSRIPKYGSLNKGFEEEELVRFMNALEDPKAELLFTFQAVLGLRISEVVRINIKDINLKTKDLRIHNEKADRIDYLPIPPQLFNKTLDFITQNEDDISSHKGFLFWADLYPEYNNCPHISKNFVRNIFRHAIKKAKLDETYGVSEGNTPKLLHRLTTHSLRHYAITHFARKNNGNITLTSAFARHRDLKTTMTYVYTNKKELYESLVLAEEDGVLSKVRKMQEMSK